ncbi:MAG: CotH kinase family protein [Sphaerochaetaceae bacterium]
MKKINKIVLIIMLVVMSFSPLVAGGTAEKTVTNEETVTSNEVVISEENTILDVTDITVHKMEIEISQEDWEALLAAPEDEEFYSANATYDGEVANNVAFRTKGNSTLSSVAKSDSERYSFKIKVDKYEDDQLLNSMNEIVLNSNFADASYLREYITYSASDYLGLITPETEFTELYINGELYGLYLYVESYDDTFIENNTVSEDAVLYKADGDNCTLLENDSLAGFDLQEGDDESFENLKTLQNALASVDEEGYDQLEEILDTDSVLKWAALSYFTGNYDSYLGDKAHNYFLLYDEGKIKMVGWDYNMSFGIYPLDSGSSLKLEEDNIFSNTTAEERPLVAKLLENSEYQQKFYEYVDELQNWFSTYEQAISKMSETLYPYVENDPTAFYTIDEFVNNTSDTGLSLDDIQNTSMRGEIANDQLPTQDGEMRPDMIDGQLPPQGGMRPDMTEGQLPPQGGMRPNMTDSQLNSQEGAMRPEITDGQMMPQGGMKAGSMNNQSSLSIVDYIRLRLAGLN